MSSHAAGAARIVPTRTPRRGVASVLAMLYTVLFASLAVGFYAATNMSAQVGFNEQRMAGARSAAESGMELMRYHLSLVGVPPLTPETVLMDEVYKDLAFHMDYTGNLGGKVVGMNSTGTEILIPAGTNDYITVDPNGSKFRCVITRSGRQLIVRTYGFGPGATTSAGGRSGVELKFSPDQEHGSFFNYGMASRGTITINPQGTLVKGVPAEFGSVMSLANVATPVTIGAATNMTTTGITGEITVLQGTTPSLLGPVSVDGETNPALILPAANDHVNYITAATAPEFPVADTSIFKQYATNPYVAGLTTYDNVIIPPNTNPTFNGPTTIRGVLYIQQPNVVKFSGNVTIQAVIATEHKGVGTLTSNSLQFSGNGGAKLPVSDLPLEPKFDGIRDLTGSFVVAPGFDVQFSGNFGTVSGDIAGDRISISGNSSATIVGSLVSLKPNAMSIGGSVDLTLKQDPNSLHSGIRHTENYNALPSTWREIRVP